MRYCEGIVGGSSRCLLLQVRVEATHKDSLSSFLRSLATHSKLKNERSRYKKFLDAAPVEHQDKLLVELNVVQQMEDARKHPQIARAINDRGLKIHGLVFERQMNQWVQLVLA